MKHSYGGLNFESPIPFPLPLADGPVDFFLQHAEQVSLTSAEFTFDLGSGNREQLLAAVPGFDWILIRHGKEAIYTALQDPHSEPLKFILLDFIYGCLSVQRGALVLEALVVMVAGRTILVVGPPDARSALAAAVKRRGEVVLCDGAIAVALDQEHATVHGTARYLRLTPETAALLEPQCDCRFLDCYLSKVEFDRSLDRPVPLDLILNLAGNGAGQLLDQDQALISLLGALWFQRLASCVQGQGIFLSLKALAARVPAMSVTMKDARMDAPEIEELIESFALKNGAGMYQRTHAIR
ncbi:MAG: hypothetical protein K1X83_11370 [Oligoflexia bacterium]|nr:hypothetical protein [Oligoflexia bacterium]